MTKTEIFGLWRRGLSACAAVLGVFSLSAAYAAPGGTLTVVEHKNTYPAPQNLMASLTDDGRNITLQWDGVRWPADGFPEEVDGEDVPTNFYYEVFCRTRESGTTEWSAWWNSDNPGRFDWKTDAFLERVTMTRAAGAGTNYQFRVRCVQYVNPKDPHLLPESERIQNVYSSDYTDIVTAYKTLDKLEIALQDYGYSRLQGMLAINLTYDYTSSRAAEGEEPLYFTFKAIEVPYPAPGTATESPAVGGKPYARRDGTPLPVTEISVRPPDSVWPTTEDPTNFTLTAVSGTVEYPGEIAWYVYDDLKNYYHTNVTIWVQGWAKPETEGGAPRLVLDEAIGDLTIDTRGLTATPQPDQGSVLLTWPTVPGAATYKVWRAGIKESDPFDCLEEYSPMGQAGTVSFTDMNVVPLTRYRYKVEALDAAGTQIDESDSVIGYSQLDDLSLVAVQPQTPWNGKVDILLKYKTARDVWGRDGIPRFKLFAQKGGEPVEVKTLRRSVGGPYDTEIGTDDFSLYGTVSLNRLEWDVGTDLGAGTFDDLTFLIECVRVEQADVTLLPWTDGAVSGTIPHLDTRSPREVNLAEGTRVYVDLDWIKDGNVCEQAEVFCNGKKVFELPDEAGNTRGSVTLGKNELNIWGENELKFVPDFGEGKTAIIKYPDFDFSVSQGVADGITLKWSTLDSNAVAGYQIRRRAKGSTADFETVKTVGLDVTTYTDTTADEAGAYEYTVVPLNSDGEAIGPAPAAQRGYRSLDKIEIVQARQLYPWTTQVALDVYFASGRDEATDGAVTYRLEAKLADGTPIPLRSEDKTLRLETVDGLSLDPANIPFGSKPLPSGKTTRIWWNAPNLGQVQVSDPVVSNIVLRIVPKLADDAPEGAVAAPAPAVKDGLAVDLRKVRPVQVGEKIPIVWEWMRTDTRDETKDRTEISLQLVDGTEKVILTPEQKTGAGEIEVTDEMWTGFHLLKREKNDDDESDVNVIELTSEVLFQLPAERVTNVTASQGKTEEEKVAVTVEWGRVPNATSYQLTIATYGTQGTPTTRTQYVSGRTSYVDKDAPEIGLVKYTVAAVYPNGATGASSEPAVGWRALDKAELTNVSTRRPWAGTVDIDLTYQTVRGRYAEVTGTADNLPERRVAVAVTTADGTELAVGSLVRETLDGRVIRREEVMNAAFTLGANDRLIWDARADAPKMYEPGATLTVMLEGDLYSETIVLGKTFDLDTRTGVIDLPFGSVNVPIPWSTRWAKPEVKEGYLGAGENDAWWKQTAVLTDVTDSANPVEILRTEAKLGEGTINSWTPKNWGLNTITLILKPVSGGNGQTEYAAVFRLPDFAFSATTNNADGVTITWNELDGAASYEIRRRQAGTTNDYETVTSVTNATSWTDSSVDTVVGDFEYVVVPIAKSGATLPLLPAKSGTRGAPQTVQNVVASQGDTNAVTVTWDAVPNAAHYRIGRIIYGPQGQNYDEIDVDGTRYVDTAMPLVSLVKYTVKAIYANGMEGAKSDATVGWRALDAVDWKGVSTRWPWNGAVDIDFVYQTVRGRYAEATGAATNLPERTVTVAVKTAGGAAINVKTLALEALDSLAGTLKRQKVNANGSFTLTFADPASENNAIIVADRLTWNAPADQRLLSPESVLTVTLAGDAYGEPIVFEKTFDLDSRRKTAIELPFGAADIQIPWSTRWAMPEATSLGSTDNWWMATAVLSDNSASPVEVLKTNGVLGVGAVAAWTPKKWGVNMLTLVLSPASGGNSTTNAALFKLPDFDFSATTNDADGVTITWNELDGAASYEIRRRQAGTTNDYETVTSVTNATSWTDSSVDTVVGDFEYVVVPIAKSGATLPLLPAKSGTRGAPQTVQNVVASQGDTNAVTVTWDAVPHAAYYKVAVENWDVAINKKTRTVETNVTRFVDTELPRPGLGRYTVTAVYANGMTGAPSEAAVGYAALDTMQILGVSTRWPWNGKVDLDIEYKTVRPRFNELFGLPNLPYPTNVTLAAQTAEGSAITVATLEREPAVDRNYTVNRKAVENGTAIFSGSGWLRLVWDADKDTQNNLLATNATLTLTVADDYSSLTDSCTVDIDTTKPVAIPLPEASETNDREIAFPWAARWADEASRTLNMQDGTDLEIVTVTRYGAVTNVVETQTQLSDEGSVFTWRPGDSYGVLIVEGSFSNRATAASSTYRSKFLRSVATPVTVERVPGQNALDIKWTFSADCTYYQIIRREVYADGTRSPWQNMAPLSGPWYRDIGVTGGKTYEYAACPMYPDPDTHDYITAEPVVWTAGSAAVGVTFDALGPYLSDGKTEVEQYLGEAYGTLPEPTRIGCRFEGWFLGVTNGAPEAVSGANLLVPGNHRLYAKWGTAVAITVSCDTKNGGIDISWDAAAGVAGYDILRRRINRDGTTEAWTVRATVGADVTSWRDTGVDGVSVYEYAVRIRDANPVVPGETLETTSSGSASGWVQRDRLTLTDAQISNPWDGTVSVSFTYASGQPIASNEGVCEVRVLDRDGNPLTVRTLKLNGQTVANGAFTLDLDTAQGAVSRGRIVWTAGVDMPKTYLEGVTLRVRMVKTGTEATTASFTLNTYDTHVVFDALGRWFATGTSVVTQTVGSVYGAFPAAARAGYQFLGWFDGVTNGAPEAVSGATPLTRENHTLYAKWQVNTAASPVTDAHGNSIFKWEANGAQEATILGFRDPNRKIEDLVLPDMIAGRFVTAVKAGAFNQSKCGMTSLTLPVYCRTIGAKAFYGIATLTRVTITPVRDWTAPMRAGALAIGKEAFGSTGLESVYLPVEVASVGDSAFANCKNLQSLTLLGKPVFGSNVFRRSGIWAGSKPTIHLSPDVAADTDYLASLKGSRNDVLLRFDALVTGLSLGAPTLPRAGVVRLAVGVTRAAEWGQVDASRVRVEYRARLGDAPQLLTPRVTPNADGSMNLEVDVPGGSSGFFRVKLED